MNVTGHKSVQYLMVYQCVESSEKMSMGKALVNSLGNTPKQQKTLPVLKPKFKAQPSTSKSTRVAPAPAVPFHQNIQQNEQKLGDLLSANSTELIPYQPNFDNDGDNNFDLVKILEEVDKEISQVMTQNTSNVINCNSPRNTIFAGCKIEQIHFHVNKK